MFACAPLRDGRRDGGEGRSRYTHWTKRRRQKSRASGWLRLERTKIRLMSVISNIKNPVLGRLPFKIRPKGIIISTFVARKKLTFSCHHSIHSTIDEQLPDYSTPNLLKSTVPGPAAGAAACGCESAGC